MNKKLLVGLGAIALTAGLAQFISSQAQSGKNIALVTPYLANATTKLVIEKFQKLGAAKGWKVTVTDTAGDFNQLVSAIQNAVTLKSDAIVLGMGDPAQMTQGLKAAMEAKIGVFGIDAGVAAGVLANVTSDNGLLGSASAEDLAKRMAGKGTVVMFTHDPHPGVRARAAAAEAVFKKFPNIKIMSKHHIDVPGPLDNARKIMQDLLTANPAKGSIDGVWAGWDEPAMGAVQAGIAAKRTEFSVVGVDGTDFALAEMKKGGAFKATVSQDWDGIAAKTVELVENHLKGKSPDKQMYTLPGKLITQESVK